MADAGAQAVRIELDAGGAVSGLLEGARGAAGGRACCVLAHGAGAGMRHAFMAQAAEGLAARGVATLRYQFPYMERGSRRPDAPAVAHSAVRAAVREAGRLGGPPDLPLIAGGKSFGGRMTSQAQAEAPLPGVRGLVFFGFPLHPAGKPSTERAEHLFKVNIPMLFLQGTRDDLARLELLEPIIGRLGAPPRPPATLKVIQGADHSFHVPAKTGSTDADVREELLDAVAGWLATLIE
jgi:predicted alpha/beta-hydrolase family hydrolase